MSKVRRSFLLKRGEFCDQGCSLFAGAQLQLNTVTKHVPAGFPVVLRAGQGTETPLCSGFTQRDACPADLVLFPVCRSDVRAVAVLRCHGLELELLADPCALGFPLPDSSKHPLLAAGGLPL